MTDQSRLEYLAEYLMDKIGDDEGTEFAIRTGEGEFAWISPEDQEVILVSLQPARFVVAHKEETL